MTIVIVMCVKEALEKFSFVLQVREIVNELKVTSFLFNNYGIQNLLVLNFQPNCCFSLQC